jgi:hypothetical protein
LHDKFSLMRAGVSADLIRRPATRANGLRLVA